MPLRNTSAYRCAGSVVGGGRHITYQQVTNVGNPRTVRRYDNFGKVREEKDV